MAIAFNKCQWRDRERRRKEERMFQQKIQQDALSGSGTVGDYHYGDDSDDDDDMYGFDVDDAIYPIRYSTTFSF